jgi:hypothetical protein
MQPGTYSKQDGMRPVNQDGMTTTTIACALIAEELQSKKHQCGASVESWRQKIDMPTLYRRKKIQTGQRIKALHKLSRLYARVRSQAFAYFAIVAAERSARRKVEAARGKGGWTTQGKNE